MRKFTAYLRLIRPINCVMMGFAVIVGATITDPNVLGAIWPKLVLGFVTGFMLTGASMSINDYYDRAIDIVNEPNRPIPSGLIKSREALVFAIILTVIGFGVAFLTNVFCFVVAVFAWGVSVSYTIIGKRSGLPGNLLVSTLGVMPFVYGNYVVVSTIDLRIVIFASMVFLSMTGREITKGIADVEGDKMQNVKTLAVRFGEKNAAFVATIFYMIAVSLSPIPWFLGIVSVFFIPLVALTDLGLLVSSLMLLRDHSRENARRIKKTVLYMLLIGLLAFFVGTFR